MSRIYIDNDEQEAVTEIAWLDYEGETEYLSSCGHSTRAYVIHNSADTEVILYREDIPKLIKALEKAMELGWHKA